MIATKCHFFKKPRFSSLFDKNAQVLFFGPKHFSGQAQPRAESKPKWDIYTGIVLERKPILTQKMTPLEKKYSQFLAQYELELSKKSDHEIRHENDLKILEKVKTGEAEPGTILKTAQDFFDTSVAELKQFKAASRVTDADAKNDTQSTNRALDSHLLLVVEQKLGESYKYMCPHGKHQDGETLRETTERTIRELCPNIKAKILGNAPWGFYKYNYPPGVTNSAGESIKGAKVFFYKAQLVSGEVTKNEVLRNFFWLKRDELIAKLEKPYYKSVAKILINE